MALRLSDKWIWDFWLARAEGHHHVFYLQAPRSLRRPELRHHSASIGHAVSTDLLTWEVLPDALHPGPRGSWDDLATWTGSVIKNGDLWYMLYTGINRGERGLIQRIGLATSPDLIHWTKHPENPVLEADERWYERLDLARWRDQSWRDPWLFIEPMDGSVHALITARSPNGNADGGGVIGHACSLDFVHWEVLPPLTSPGEFAQVECPQLVSLDGRYLILFSCLAEDHSAARTKRLGARGVTGTFVLSSTDFGGPYSPSATPIAEVNEELGPLYAGKLVEIEPEEWSFMAFRGAGDHAFVGELTDPLPVLVDGDGELRTVAEPPVQQARRSAMALAREVRELLAWDEELGKSCDGLPLHERRLALADALEERARRAGLFVADVGLVEDYTVPVKDGDIQVRLYSPSDAGPFPAFLHIHGGGFMLGSIDWVFNDAKCAHICQHARCVVATVEYRLAPESPFPVAPEDCYAALLWLVEHADELDIDASRIAVGGESAGGNLAAVLALMSRDRGGPPLALQLLEVPVTDMSDRSDEHASLTLFDNGYGLDRRGIEDFQDAYLPNRADRVAAYASPLRAEHLNGVAPAHIITAEFDPLRDSGEAYARRLQEAGVRTTLHRFKGQIHGSSSLWQTWPPAGVWMDEVVAALRDVASVALPVG